ncbi:hypothetical protein [Phyllobacterium chamaecytisi]|uniref:hypothetical protein n=1 Tax=Phyllobacterium chamaecytisi TaxID=2876082 RepID=UPI001CC9C60D|nr:hypothetical protein [Phyllobacterium sp. KW56]MBZ9603961.1 hypothetical protein [Phyllobacterium sp. KW56]
MLAKVSQKQNETAHFRAVLQLPPQSAELIAAEESYTVATGARVQMAKRFEDAKLQASVDATLKRRIATVTPEQITAIQDELLQVVGAETSARAAFDTVHREYSEATRSALRDHIAAYVEAIAQKAAELDELISAGAALSEQATRAHISLRSPVIATSSQMQKAYLSPLIKLVRGWL